MFSHRTDVPVSFAGEQADRWAGAAASPARVVAAPAAWMDRGAGHWPQGGAGHWPQEPQQGHWRVQGHHPQGLTHLRVEPSPPLMGLFSEQAGSSTGASGFCHC